jgi:hypothetical protein
MSTESEAPVKPDGDAVMEDADAEVGYISKAGSNARSAHSAPVRRYFHFGGP